MEIIMKKIIKFQSVRTMLISFGIVFLMFSLVCVSSHLMFETNDDVFMKMILSGEYTGTPSSYVIHMNIFVGFIISLLYRIIPIIPFYALFFIFILYFSFSYILYITIKCFNNKKIIPWIIVVFCVLFTFAFSGFLIEMQYTLVAAISCACGIYGLFIVDYKNKKFYIDSIPILILLSISFCIRDKVFFMLFPFAILILIINLSNKKVLVNVIKLLGIILSAIFILFLINKVAYSSDEWSDFKKYNGDREKIVDLYVIPQYGEYEKIYNELGISYSSYIAFTQYYCTEMDKSYNDWSLNVLSDIGQKEYNKTLQVISFFNNYFNIHFNKENKHLSVIIFFMYALLVYIGIILYRKEKRNGIKKKESVYLLNCIILFFLISTSIWGYMIIHDKFPRRVTNGVLFAELLILIAFIVKYAPKILKRNVIIGFITIVLAICVLFGIPQLIELNKMANTYYEISKVYDDIRQYTDQHDESIYLCDTFSFAYFVNNDLRLEEKHSPNLLMLGGWTANSPWHKEIYRNNDIDNILDEFVKGERVFFIVQRSDGDDIGYVKDFVDEATGEDNDIEIYDSIICGNDKVSAVYDVYKVYK